MIGKIVRVKVDRPLGSVHPDYPEHIYPINYGYVEGIIAPDKEEQDVYILGVDETVDEYEGEVIAVIKREDDVEEKWVVAPRGIRFTSEDIKEAVKFQEKYFKFHIEM
ncbi:inorganic pyrophosphatase [Fusobacterium russii]|uniref:inorganic pyrophosphatase n=1 Tax=Fusobacterium russii TaxID=854 RepID=UPI0003A177B8|nr:inorganic pyrophosphatase [Fusobacterium russii]